MSQEQIQVAEKTQQMLQGPLKHVRAAAQSLVSRAWA